MNARELSALIGTHCFIEPAPGLRVRVRIANVKTRFGHKRVKVEAIGEAGEGSAWFNVENVRPCYPNGIKQGGEHVS